MNALTSQLQFFADKYISLAGGLATLFISFWKSALLTKIEKKSLQDQIYQVGVRSFLLVIVTALCSGMVMALQFGLGLQKFGGQLYVPKIVSLSFIRELAPVFTGLVVAGRVGAGYASEIGSMVVTQQVDAIRALGTSPIV
ncbi:MAG: ABC transporter permease, partial [Bdellovibrionales bacterium]|nr:ABC transporter permease [Bdellovibrionales bacterium]